MSADPLATALGAEWAKHLDQTTQIVRYTHTGGFSFEFSAFAQALIRPAVASAIVLMAERVARQPEHIGRHRLELERVAPYRDLTVWFRPIDIEPAEACTPQQ